MKEVYYRYVGRKISNKKEYNEAHIAHIFPILIEGTAIFCLIISLVVKPQYIDFYRFVSWLALSGVILSFIIEIIIYLIHSEPKYEMWSKK